MKLEDKWLIDTDVLVDYWRGQPSAVAFIQQAPVAFWVYTMTVAELFAGIREGAERELLEDSIKTYLKLEISEEIATIGGFYRRDYGKSHGVGLADALIAATAKLHDCTLVTLNRKHFPMVAKILVPYQKP